MNSKFHAILQCVISVSGETDMIFIIFKYARLRVLLYSRQNRSLFTQPDSTSFSGRAQFSFPWFSILSSSESFPSMAIIDDRWHFSVLWTWGGWFSLERRTREDGPSVGALEWEEGLFRGPWWFSICEEESSLLTAFDMWGSEGVLGSEQKCCRFRFWSAERIIGKGMEASFKSFY